ncbi:MAG: hypothetical protein Ct9H300mP28_27730 [Pseudomonadota bacterium]|nr:MAG: hypothetical protein Ct9H300mP28_27730 [Pseudomonadota bacterium]
MLPAQGLLSLLTLGIPGSGTTGVLLGALIALNLQPGPLLMQDRPEVFWSLFFRCTSANHPFYPQPAVGSLHCQTADIFRGPT